MRSLSTAVDVPAPNLGKIVVVPSYPRYLIRRSRSVIEAIRNESLAND